MAKLTKSEWAIFILNLMLIGVILTGIIWALSPQSKPCWNNTASEEQNLISCEEHSK